MPSTKLIATKKTPVQTIIRDKRTFIAAANNEALFKTKVVVVRSAADLDQLRRTLNDTKREFAVCLLVATE